MKRYDQMSSLAWLIFAVYVCFESIRLPLGSWRDPGPGFIPLTTGLLLGTLSIILFLQVSLSESKELKASWYPKERWLSLIRVLATLFGYAFGLEIFGFLVTTFLLLFFLFKFGLEPQRWIPAIAGSAVISCSSYAIFELWLKTQLPRGIWWGF
jgi:hypothetical protein